MVTPTNKNIKSRNENFLLQKNWKIKFHLNCKIWYFLFVHITDQGHIGLISNAKHCLEMGTCICVLYGPISCGISRNSPIKSSLNLTSLLGPSPNRGLYPLYLPELPQESLVWGSQESPKKAQGTKKLKLQNTFYNRDWFKLPLCKINNFDLSNGHIMFSSKKYLSGNIFIQC